jgi:signal transduction histidine kinase
MIKLKSPFTKSNIVVLSIVYLIAIIFFFTIAFEQDIESFLGAVKISTVFILIPTLIGWYLLKWIFEAVLTIFQIDEKDYLHD